MQKTLSLLLSLPLVSAIALADTIQQAEPAATARPIAHPTFQFELYPSWSKLTPQQCRADVEVAMQVAREELQNLRRVRPEKADYESVFGTFEKLGDELDRAESLIHTYASVMDNPELRRLQEELLPELTAFAASVTSDAQLWQLVKTAADAPWVKTLSEEKQRYVNQVVDRFRDSGAELSPAGKKRYTEILRELTALRTQFDKNVLDATNAWEWIIDDPNLLRGMSPTWMETASAAARERGRGTPEKPCWLITLQEPSACQVIFNCEVEATRKRCWEGLSSIGSKAPYDNAPIVARVMELRSELAALLGFDNFTDLVLKHRMAGSGRRAMEFVDDLLAKVKNAYDSETRELLDFIAREKGESPKDKINPWDSSYYLRKLRRQRYNFDVELLRPYQEAEHVLRGMFRIFQHLYGIRIVEQPTFVAGNNKPLQKGAVEVWHPEVRVFAVYDGENHLGSFYVDLFPRASKRSGAWVQPIRYGMPAEGTKPHTPHLALLAANITPATKNQPALLSHRDVETVFHEFGHMMHTMLGDTEVRAHCGSDVAWDFVEMPSQMNENWTWEPESMAAYAVHYKTGEPIPAEYVKKLIQTRYFFPAHDNMGQLCIAKLDMEMHMHYAEKFRGKNLDDATAAVLDPWRAPMTVQPPSIMHNLTHCISGGYAGAYYSYKWSEVLAADVFSVFEKEGVLNSRTGREYRNCILSRGDSAPPEVLFRNFVKRDPDPNSLLRKQGLVK